MTKSKSFPINDSVRITTTVRVDDVLTAPGTFGVEVEAPSGSIVLPEVTNQSTGVYWACFVPDEAGYYRYRVTTTGNFADGVREGTFYVHTSGLGEGL